MARFLASGILRPPQAVECLSLTRGLVQAQDPLAALLALRPGCDPSPAASGA